MKEQDYEDRIWEFSNVLRSKTDLWRLVKGDKKTCFDKINEMVQTSQLKEIPEGNKIMYVRIDSIKKAEFESTFKFQVKMLTDSRVVIKKLKKPMFQKIRSLQIVDKKGEFKPRTKEVKGNFENMEFYSSALMLFTTRTHIQRSLRLLTKPEAERRIKKCENALEDHFQKLQDENPRESNAIRQYFKHKIFGIENFRIS